MTKAITAVFIIMIMIMSGCGTGCIDKGAAPTNNTGSGPYGQSNDNGWITWMYWSHMMNSGSQTVNHYYHSSSDRVRSYTSYETPKKSVVAVTKSPTKTYTSKKTSSAGTRTSSSSTRSSSRSTGSRSSGGSRHH